jgi:hypothetical protein
VVDAVETNGANQQFHYHLEVTSNTDKDVVLAYSVTFADDRGNVIEKSTPDDRPTLQAKSETSSRGLSTPGGLKDGFYRAIFYVASMGDSDGLVDRVDWWLEVKEGQLLEVTAEDWFERSRAKLGFKEAAR